MRKDRIIPLSIWVVLRYICVKNCACLLFHYTKRRTSSHSREKYDIDQDFHHSREEITIRSANLHAKVNYTSVPK